MKPHRRHTCAVHPSPPRVEIDPCPQGRKASFRAAPRNLASHGGPGPMNAARAEHWPHRAAKRHRVAGEGRQCAHAECSLLPSNGTQAKHRKQPSCRLTTCKKQLCSRSPLSVAHFTAASEVRLSLSDAQSTSRDFPMDYCKRDPPSARVKLPRCNQSQTTWKGLGAMTDTQKTNTQTTAALTGVGRGGIFFGCLVSGGAWRPRHLHQTNAPFVLQSIAEVRWKTCRPMRLARLAEP